MGCYQNVCGLSSVYMGCHQTVCGLSSECKSAVIRVNVGCHKIGCVLS